MSLPGDKNGDGTDPSSTEACTAAKRVKQPAPSFATLGVFLSSDPDLQIYRRFEELASRNLAYLQSELMALNDEIETLDEVDRKEAESRSEGWMESQLPARCWEIAEREANDGNERSAERMRLAKKLRVLMAEYQEALLRQSRVLNLDAPPKRSKQVLSRWFKEHRPLVGSSYGLFDDQNQKGLVALCTPPDQDRLTSLLQSSAGYFIKSKEHEDHDWAGVTYFSDDKIKHVVSVLSVVLSAVLLVGAIVALYFAPSKGVKLGLIAVFTTMFAASIGLLTNARKTEIYASTAAWVNAISSGVH